MAIAISVVEKSRVLCRCRVLVGCAETLCAQELYALAYLGIWNVTSSCLEWNLAIRSWFAVIPSYVNSELAVGGCDTTYMKAVQLATIPLEVEHF